MIKLPDFLYINLDNHIAIGEHGDTVVEDEMMIEKDKLIKNDCYHCKHKRNVPGNSHIKCVKPDEKMTGDAHGIKQGWFIYPLLFDPIWCSWKCRNYRNENERGY